MATLCRYFQKRSMFLYFNSNKDGYNMSLSLANLTTQIRELFSDERVNIEEVTKVLLSYKSKRSEWHKYAHFDDRNYTRNLVDTGNGAYNMILLCWGPGACTNVHDHSKSHCFMKMLQGELLETRFDWPSNEGSIEPLKKSAEALIAENDVAYMSDEIGLHRVENPSHTEPAVSLHIYSPAYEKCFLFDQRTSQKHVANVTFWSVNGKKEKHVEMPFDKITSVTRQG